MPLMSPPLRPFQGRGTISLALAFALMATSCATTASPPPLSPHASRQPIALTLPLLRGGQFNLKAWRGEVVVITIFATWSLRAQAEGPRFKQLAARFRPRNLQIVAIAIDRNERSLVKTYVDFVGFRFPVALADPEDLHLVGALGLTRRVPRTLLIDRTGRIRQDHRAGQTDFPRLIRGIETCLAEARPTH